jgi:hypothetical protein
MGAKYFFLLCISIASFSLSAQVKGKSKHLVGTWKYNEGSGYEIWTFNGKELVGAGYRSSKVGDSIKVEDLKLAVVNKNLIYTVVTNQAMNEGNVSVKHQFIGHKRKLYFVNMENELPISIRYAFGFFSKKRMKITIQLKEREDTKVLRLTKIT